MSRGNCIESLKSNGHICSFTCIRMLDIIKIINGKNEDSLSTFSERSHKIQNDRSKTS